MKHDYLSNTALNDAKSIFLSAADIAGFYAKNETAAVTQSIGRITGAAVYAIISAPHYNASAMDGVAISAASTFGASEQTPVVLQKDRFTVVDTGDVMPEGADAVVMIEDVHWTDEGGVKLFAAVSPWQNVRQVGEDLCMGDMIAPAGTRITPALAGAFMAGGVTEVTVKTRPVFGIIPTGDEIVPPTGTPAPGEIIEFNSTIVSGMLAQWQADSRIFGIVKDNKSLLRDAVQITAASCDAVLVLAGSSAGRDDYTASVCAELGEVLLHGVAVKPGKPVVLGMIGCKPIVGLPGYPVSAMVIMEQLVKPLTEMWYGCANPQRPTAEAVLTKNVMSSLKYEEFVRVTLGTVGDACYAVPLPRGAGVITSVTKADGILRVPQNTEGIQAGERVSVQLLRPKQELTKTLVITGSHDPLIDEIRDLIARQNRGFSVVSSHVGSMGAFRAVAAGQAHMGACHLLDEATGKYNRSYVDKYFPNGGASLHTGVGRTQGIMVKPGNPMGITGVGDLKRCRYVNRQRGAGTRVLLDYLLKQNGISSGEINGYNNEKFTHSAVAATIAAGNADAGMGILSAARIYGLDFIPLWQEEYDFLVNDAYKNDPMVLAFFEILESDSFRKRLREMGGYSTIQG